MIHRSDAKFYEPFYVRECCVALKAGGGNAVLTSFLSRIVYVWLSFDIAFDSSSVCVWYCTRMRPVVTPIARDDSQI